MRSKFEMISSVYQDIRSEICRSPKSWTSFLKSACHNYKLPFDELVLIYAQRPDATAVLEFDKWNKKFGRRINAEAKGIAVFDKTTGKHQMLKYYFDISDTHETEFSKAVPVWKMKREYEQAVIETLEKTFGELKNKSTLIDAVLSAADNATEDNISDYADVLVKYKQNTFLEELDDDSIRTIYTKIVKNSVAYLIAARLDLDVEKYFDREDFEYIGDFNNDEAINSVGCATRDISEIALNEVSKKVLSLKKINRTFENKENVEYTNTEDKLIERSINYGKDNNIQETGRSAASELGVANLAESQTWNVGGEAQKLPDEFREEPLYNALDELQLGSASARYTDESRTDGRTVDETDGGSRGLDRGTQENRYDEMGAGNEQSQTQSAGDSPQRSDLLLESNEIPPFIEERKIIEMLSNPDDDLVYPKKFIVNKFNKCTREQFVKLIPTFYGGRLKEFNIDGVQTGYEYQNDGLLMYEGTYNNRTKESVFSWDIVSQLISQLVEDGKYLPKKEKHEPAQISLFDAASEIPEEQVNEVSEVSFSTNFEISQQVVDEAICLGTHEKNAKLRITAFLKKDKPMDTAGEFIKKEYEEFASGFIFEGQKYSVLADNSGFRIALGNSAHYRSATVITWEEVAIRIRELLELGVYMPQFQLDMVDKYERETLTDSLVYMTNDIADDFKEKYMTTISGVRQQGLKRSEYQNTIAEKLNDKSQITAILDELTSFNEDFKKNKSILRFPRFYNIEEMIGKLEDLKLPQLEFKGQPGVPEIPSRFISDDEINWLLRKGDTESRLWYYSLYKTEPVSKKRELEIKNRHGLSGSHDGIANIQADSKGYSLSRGPLMEPYAKVLLSWKDVEKRIGNMIAMDTFLTKEDKEYIPTYEKKQIAFQIGYFFREVGDDNKKPFGLDNNHYWDNIDKVVNHLDEPQMVESVYEEMQNIFQNMSEDDREFEIRRKALEKVSQYQDGTFSLFGEKKEPRKVINVSVQEKTEDVEPYIVCEWSEHNSFEDGKKYSVPEFDRIMKLEDETWIQEREAEVKRNGSVDAAFDNDDAAHQGYAKTKFTLYMPDGSSFSERQDIGDGCGGVIDFLRKFPKYENIVPILNKLKEKQEKFDEQDNPQDVLSSLLDENVVDTNSEITEQDFESSYRLLSRLQSDCEYYLGNGNRSQKYLWAGNVEDQISKMRELYSLVPVKPEWLTLHDIDNYEQQMVVENKNVDAPVFDKHNFELSNFEIDTVGKKERFHRNMNAINVLKECEFDSRLATPEEQKVLAQYVGWGGIPEAFDNKNNAWADEYKELIVALSPEEYDRARESTLTAFYTPPVVISAIYNAFERFGFKRGNILEPSCGIGNFIGMLPKSMENSKVYGVELDTISAGIAQQLYQKSTIKAQGYETVNYPDNFFDVVIGNVPFGDFKVADKRYDKYNFLIHDYFFAKSLDKLRPGGILAFVTSKGTLDKESSSVRKYIAQRAELLGAIRLPNDTFKGNAGTEVVSDILFLQKRESILNIEPEWVHLDTDANGIKMNSYFVKHPEMVLGEMKMVSGRFGMEATCSPYENANIFELLDQAISNINAEIKEVQLDDIGEQDEELISADPNIQNFSFGVHNGKVYFRENSMMKPFSGSNTAESRIKGLIGIRDCLRNLLEIQKENYPDDIIKAEQKKLNSLYDNFTSEFGIINGRANSIAFSEDSSYFLLCALEHIEDGKLVGKADVFTKRTIKPHTPITQVDNSSDALALSIGEKAAVDMEYMSGLTGKSEELLYEELKGVIFFNPLYGYGDSTQQKYLTADEYLSGNVREKLAIARKSADIYPDDYTINVQALEKVQPKDLSASEISVRLGATWIPATVFEQFIYEFLSTPRYAQYNIKVNFSEITGEWNVSGKNYDSTNVKASSTYGTKRINAYKIIEETLNLKDVRIFDYGKKKAELNRKETAIAQAKQELIKNGFQEWIWSDPSRREKLTKLYNEKFNSIRPREYDGTHIVFSNMNSEIELREHQRNAVAHILYGGNTLLAHTVGAGKTFEMIAAGMEKKALGLCTKSLYVVPNHLIEQWANDFMLLYPGANILVASKKDFETKNRKRFCGRIATGNYDAVIIGHSQFEKIPMSIERQRAVLEEQLDEIVRGITDLKNNRGENFSIKQLEKTKKQIKLKLDKLNDQSRKDDVVTFEELGIDSLFIDESHYYKNLFLYTKMRNVGGIAQTEAQKSSDLFMKCRYLDEITGGRGVVFATGTPISNSMVELYTIQRYLQYNTLERNGLQHFDAWASTFGETVTAVELTPEGTGYRAKTRFAKFYNLPELMSMFKEVADIKTADVLKLPVPDVEYHNVSVQPSEIQKDMVNSLSERAEKVRDGIVEPTEDNMLKITNDGRKLALDQRLINPMLPDFEGSKINACVENIYSIWDETKENKLTQLVFCDLSTPKNDGSFNVYDDIKNKLIECGVPEEEIKFIHEAKTEKQKDDLFKKVRNGDVRVLLGSTQKMGAGTNVQDKLIALHDIDCPWRPSDLEQRSGRIIRQGNKNPKVHIYRYVTEQTFDAYLYQLVEGKQKFASQIMTSKSPVRSAEDIDETALSYAEIKMLATGNPLIKEKMDLDIQVQKLKLLKSNFLTERYALEDKIIKFYPAEIAKYKAKIKGFESDIVTANQYPKSADNFIGMVVFDKLYEDKKEAGLAILKACKTVTSNSTVPIGEYRGFKMDLLFDSFGRQYKINLKGEVIHTTELGTDELGNITRLDNVIDGFEKQLKITKELLAETEKQFEVAKKEVKKPFEKEDELNTKITRLEELNVLLDSSKKINSKTQNPEITR